MKRNVVCERQLQIDSGMTVEHPEFLGEQKFWFENRTPVAVGM